MTQLFANNIITEVGTGINASATSLVLDDASLMPSPTGGDYFLLTLFSKNASGKEDTWEILKVTARSSNTVTIVRAQEGTTAISWPAETPCEMRATGATFVAKQDSATAVELATTQTLTNKTLTAPVVNSPTGIVKADVGLGNVDNTSNTTERAATATLTNKTLTSPAINTPTGIVKADVGLSNVDNTADSAKPVSSAQLTALNLKEDAADKGAANGYASLGSDSKIPTAQLPALAITDTTVVANQTAQLALTAEVGDVAIRSDLNKSFILRVSPATSLSNWSELLTPTDTVLSVNSQTGAITLTTSHVADSTNKRYVTDANLTVIGNTSGTNTGDNAGVTGVTGSAPIVSSGGNTPAISISAATTSAAGSLSGADKTKLNALSGTNTGDQTNISGNAATVTTNANLTGHITSSGNAATLGSFTSAQLAAALTNETGSGVAVFSTSPTLVTPVLGTPTSGTLTNCTFPTLNQNTTGSAATVTTNANLTGHITSSGNAAVLGSFTSAQLKAALTDETGSGIAVFATSPTLVTPALGTPSALVGTNISGTAANLTAGGVTTNANLTGIVTSTGNATAIADGAIAVAKLTGTLPVASGGTGVTASTGSGSNVLNTSPTLVSPVLGAATGTSVTTTGALSGSEVIASNGLVVNSATVAASYSVPSGSNAMSIGPVSVATGQTVTVATGSRWLIL